jgi:hypothetical protein
VYEKYQKDVIKAENDAKAAIEKLRALRKKIFFQEKKFNHFAFF